MKQRLFVAVLIAASLYSPAVAAQSADLQQTVQPIVCVFTSTETGAGTSASTTCSSAEPPTVEDISNTTGGRPIVMGQLPFTHFKQLRVWVGDRWFTYMTSPYLAVDNDTWTLDLTHLPAPLAAGDYSVVVELLTDDGYLLRSVYETIFTVPVVTIIETATRVDSDVVTHIRQERYGAFGQSGTYAAMSPLPPEALTSLEPVDKSGLRRILISDVVRQGHSGAETFVIAVFGLLAVIGIVMVVKFARSRQA